MSSGFSGNKHSGSKSSSKNNTSFVKNVTSRVTGLIPSTITKWFSSPKSSNGNGSVPPAESTDSSTEDEATENSVPSQPPTKRMRLNSPSKSVHYTSVITKCSSTNTESIEPLNVVQSPLGSTFRREPKYFSTPIPSQSEEPSTTRNGSNICVYNLCGTVSTINNSINRKRKSLHLKSTNDVTKSNEKPSTSTAKGQNKRILKADLLGSPFYPGRTMYGGAASSYMNQPNIRHRKDTLVKESACNNNVITISHSARRVMDLLENYSSPSVEAKRIPQYIGSPKNNSVNSSIEGNTSNSSDTAYKKRELHVPGIAAILQLKQKSRLMNTTNVARQIIASYSSSSEYSPYHMGQSKIIKEPAEKMTTKMKTKVTRTNRHDHECELPSTINLPKATLQIDYDNLPQFSFNATGSSKTLTSSTLKTAEEVYFNTSKESDCKTKEMPKPNAKKSLSHSNESTPNNEFYRFSNPVRISNETSFVLKTPPKYTFGSPERSLEKKINSALKEKKKKNDDMVSVFTLVKETETTTVKETETETVKEQYGKQDNNDFSDANLKENNNSQDLIEIKSSDVCNIVTSIKTTDKCIDCDKKTNKADYLSPIKSSTATKWRCGDCWVDNDVSSNNCVCCGSRQPIKECTDKKLQHSIINDSTEPSKWKCSDCGVVNDSVSKKYICCGCNKANKLSVDKEQEKNITFTKDKLNNDGDWTCEENRWKKSNMTVDIASANSESGDPLNKIIKPQKDTWECSVCLVRNADIISNCVCCLAVKPGTKKHIEKKGFSFGTTSSVAFKFGIDPKQSTTDNKSSDKMTKENVSPKESETNNNVLPKASLLPSFTFGIPAQNLENKKTVEEIKLHELPKVKFTFGLPKQSQEEISREHVKPNSFSLHVKPAEDTSKGVIQNDDNESNVASFKISSSKLPANSFVYPLTSPVTDDNKKNDITTATNISANLENTEKSTNVIPTTSMASVGTTVTQSNFTFVPRINMFSSSITPVSTASTTFTPTQLPPPTVTVSLFDKKESNPTLQFKTSESTTTSTSLLFNKKSDLVSTMAQSSSTPATIFSFGNCQQNTVTQPEKPFNFTFGNKQSEANLFKNTFGNATDSNTNTPKFTLPVSISLNSSGSQTGTILGNGNGLITGNTTVSNVSGGINISAGNAVLGKNDLPSNTINIGNSLSISTALPSVSAPVLFSTPVQKDNMWPATNNNSSNLFVTNANTLQQPASFTFGANTTFNATANSAFGKSGNPAVCVQQPQNIFGMTKQDTNGQQQPPLFSNPVQSSPTPLILFGAPSQANNNTTPSVGMFNTSNVGDSSTFGTPNPSIPGFEAPITQAPPAFNFGSQQPTAVFGFPQQLQQQTLQPQHSQPQQQSQPGNLYNFGITGNSPQVQFSMGSAPNTNNTTGRRVKKAIRRTTPR